MSALKHESQVALFVSEKTSIEVTCDVSFFVQFIQALHENLSTTTEDG